MSFDQVLPQVVQTVRSASSLAAQDVNFHRSVDSDFSLKSAQTSRKLVNLANDVIEAVDGDSLDIEKDEALTSVNWKSVSNTVDSLFEKVESLFDEIHRGSAAPSKYTYLEDSNNTNFDDSRKKSKKMEKPQDSFRVKVDTTEKGPFKPLLESKPNALVPYEEATQLVQPEQNEDSDQVAHPHYPHPYITEIDKQPYPESVLERKDPIPSTSWAETEAIWVSTPEGLKQMIDQLRPCSEIAVDLEHHDYRSYYGLVSLMQISNRSQDWIVDTLALRNDLQPLNEVFTNPSIVKVFHGAFMDIIWLQRDLGLYIVSLFDTYHASRKLGFPRFSLAYLLETFANFKTSKKYQLADWRIRPLSTPMLAYARSDTHFLLNIYDQLRNKLIDADNNKLQEVLYDSRQVAKRRFEYTKYRPTTPNALVTCPVMSSNPNEPYLPIVTQFNIPYHLKPVVEVLYNWRDNLARQLDESVRYIMPNQVLANLTALAPPVDTKKVLGASSYMTEFVRSNAAELAQLIQNALDHLEATDWDLVDKMQQSETPQRVTPGSARNQAEMYEELCTKNVQLLENSHGFTGKASVVFSKQEPVFGVSYGKKVRQSNYKDLEARADHAYQEFGRMKAAQQIQVEEVSEEEPEPEVKPAEIKTPLPDREEPEEHKDDIISLRQHKKQKTRPFKSTDDQAFDYANADKIMVNNSEGPRKRKKAFNPYGNDATGPRGAKKVKTERGGKSMTFKRK